jgi:hypothetical protein
LEHAEHIVPLSGVKSIIFCHPVSAKAKEYSKNPTFTDKIWVKYGYFLSCCIPYLDKI